MNIYYSATKHAIATSSQRWMLFVLILPIWSFLVPLTFSTSIVNAVTVDQPFIFTNQLSLPSGITTDNNENVIILSDAVSTTLLTKFAPNGTILAQNTIGSIFDIFAGSRLATDRITGAILMLAPDGRLIQINPQTLAASLFLNINTLQVDTGGAYDVLLGRVSPFILVSQSTYGDLALFRPGNDPNRLDLFVTGISVSQPFVMRLSINFQTPSVAAKIILTSTGTTAGNVNLPRGIAVNALGVGLTTLPVGFTPSGYFDQAVTFDARFPASGISLPQILFGKQDIASRGLSIDSEGNFYIATGIIGASACQSSGPLMVISQALNTFQCFPFINGSLVRSEDAAITPSTGVGYMTYLSPGLVLAFHTASTNPPSTYNPIHSDFNSNGTDDLAGLSGAGNVYYTTNLSTWTPIPGVLAQLIAADFNGDGHAGLAGLTSAGGIYYSINLSTWNYIPGLLNQLVAGDFNGDGKADLAGLAGNGQIFYSTNLATWTNIPGQLSKLVAGDFNGDGHADLAGRTGNGQIFYSTNLATWANIPGNLAQLVVGDFNGDGKADLAGLTSAGGIYYTTNLTTWINIPGQLSKLVAGNFNGDAYTDLAGLTGTGLIYYTTGLSTWINIPGTLSALATH